MNQILVVDDDLNYLSYCAEELRSVGYTVMLAIDGQEAFLQLQETRPDAIILDLFMPLMDGVALLQYVRKRYPSVPVILHSAHPEYANAYETWMANAFVEKTGDLSVLKRVLRQHLQLSRCEVA